MATIANAAARLGGVARHRVFQAAHIPCAAVVSAASQGRVSLGAGPARGISRSAEVAWLRPVGFGAGLAWTGQGSRGMSVAAAMVDVDGDRAAVTVSARCAQRIRKVQPEGYLRLRVDGGGCSGFQYKFELTTVLEPEDQVFEKDGARLVVDEGSLEMVRGSTVDFVEEMISSSFQVLTNPNSESSCGCGTSFAPKD